METKTVIDEDITFSPAEISLTPEQENERKALIGHEAAHAVMGYRLKQTLNELVLRDDWGGCVQEIHFKGSRRDYAKYIAAGFVGEFLTMGESWMKKNYEFIGYGDRKILKNMNYTKEEVNESALECMKLLKNDRGYKELCEVLSLRWKRGEKRFVMDGKEIGRIIALADRSESIEEEVMAV